MRPLLLLAAGCFAAAGAAAAQFDTIEPGSGAVTFVSHQMGVPVEGGFGKFSAEIAFDPGRPETGRARISIDLASIDAGSREADDEVKGKAWFDVRDYPTATFVAKGVKALGGDRYEARGTMTIKGRSADVVAPFTARPAGAALRLEGELPILRSQYGIGEGSWSDPGVVADEVRVRFRFNLTTGHK